MPYAFAPEIKHLVDQSLSSGEYASEDEVLRAALHALGDYHATIADIRQGQADHQQGRGESVTAAVADIRHHLQAKS